MICGRRTLETFPGKKTAEKPKKPDFIARSVFFVPGAEVVHSLPELFAALRRTRTPSSSAARRSTRRCCPIAAAFCSPKRSPSFRPIAFFPILRPFPAGKLQNHRGDAERRRFLSIHRLCKPHSSHLPANRRAFRAAIPGCRLKESDAPVRTKTAGSVLFEKSRKNCEKGLTNQGFRGKIVKQIGYASVLE